MTRWAEDRCLIGNYFVRGGPCKQYNNLLTGYSVEIPLTVP